MRLKESDMPEEDEWEEFFQPCETLVRLGLKRGMVFVDLGCGYGTFTLAASGIVGSEGLVYAVDIDAEKVERVALRAEERGLRNIVTSIGDIMAESGVRLPNQCADFVLLANVIHGTRRKVSLLRKAKDILCVGGVVAVLNWNLSETPRGPPMEMRPTPKQCVRCLVQAGFDDPHVLDMPPHHYAVVARCSAKRCK